jgi:hypothetical protein
MEFINATRMVTGYTMGREPSGRELLVVAIKGTFRFPSEQGSRASLDDQQVALTLADAFFGEPGRSAPRYETDYAPRKHRCDLLLNGHAYAPGGRPTDRVTVSLSVDGWSKSFDAVGDRVWFSANGVSSTAPVPFVKMPLSYDHAFGGVDQNHEDPAEHAAFMQNPAGRGFHRHLRAEWLDGAPLPNTEESGVEVSLPDSQYRPMSFGPIGRNWEPRCRYAGTYDQDWVDNVFPFLPADFDEQYYQAAPSGQQVPAGIGEQRVSLINLTAQSRRDFILPLFEAPVCIFPKKGGREDLQARVDTILFEPDVERVTLTWRVARPLKRNLFEIAQVLVGRKGPEWWQEREEVSFPIPIVVEPVRRQAHSEVAHE